MLSALGVLAPRKKSPYIFSISPSILGSLSWACNSMSPRSTLVAFAKPSPSYSLHTLVTKCGFPRKLRPCRPQPCSSSALACQTVAAQPMALTFPSSSFLQCCFVVYRLLWNDRSPTAQEYFLRCNPAFSPSIFAFTADAQGTSKMLTGATNSFTPLFYTPSWITSELLCIVRGVPWRAWCAADPSFAVHCVQLSCLERARRVAREVRCQLYRMSILDTPCHRSSTSCQC